MTHDQILKEIRQGKFAPIYYLYGEETYFTDKVVTALEESVVTPSEAAFNKEVLYGTDVQAKKIISTCRSFPVMANYRLVLVKEAHRMNKREWEKMTDYFAKPISSTILVLVFKGKSMSLPKKATTALKNTACSLHAAKLYDREVQRWIELHLAEKKIQIEAGIPEILTANLGLNINLIENELEKMLIFLKATQQSSLRKDIVYEMINVDKEFNVFELIHALSERNVYRAHMIMDRLTQNIKIHPPVLIVSNLFRFFSNLALVHAHKLRDPNSIKNQLHVNYYAAKDYALASGQYPVDKVYRNIGYIQEVDLLLKGQISTKMDARSILKTLAWRLLS